MNRQRKIGDFASVKGGKRLPAGTALTQTPTAHPYIRIVDFKDGRVDKSNLMYVPENVFPRIARYTISSDDIYISIVGTVGLTGVIDTTLDGANLTENAAKICEISDEVDRDYLAAFLKSNQGQNQIKSLSVGSTQPKLALFRIKDIEVPLPPLPEQRAIAHILGTLDDKIELNRRMNETLEELSRAIFKSWFVDFDPVKAKAEGRQPVGMDAETAALFPDSFEDSELGPIPAGWGVSSVGELCKVVTRGVTPNYQPGSDKWIINQRVNRGRELDWGNAKELHPDIEVPPEKMAHHHDVLVNCLGEGTLGRVHFFNGESGRFAVDQHMSICRATHAGVAAYLYLSLASPQGQARIEASKTGSTGMTMFNISRLRSFPVMLPPHSLTEAFGKSVLHLFDLVQCNVEESETLTELRDTLLPRLISSQLRIPDAEKLLAEAPV